MENLIPDFIQFKCFLDSIFLPIMLKAIGETSLHFLKCTSLFTHQFFLVFEHNSTADEGIITDNVSV